MLWKSPGSNNALLEFLPGREKLSVLETAGVHQRGGSAAGKKALNAVHTTTNQDSLAQFC